MCRNIGIWVLVVVVAGWYDRIHKDNTKVYKFKKLNTCKLPMGRRPCFLIFKSFILKVWFSVCDCRYWYMPSISMFLHQESLGYKSPKNYSIQCLEYQYQCPTVPGCIPADEMKFVLQHLPGKIAYKVRVYWYLIIWYLKLGLINIVIFFNIVRYKGPCLCSLSRVSPEF